MHPDPATPPATGDTATSPISDDLPPAEPNLLLPEDPELASHLARIDADLVEIAQRMATESDRAAARERVIDRQYEDIERLRGVERAGLMRPVVTDLCRLRNALLLQASTRPEMMSGAQVTDLLTSFADMVEQALERCGVAVLAREPGCPFVAGRHQSHALRSGDRSGSRRPHRRDPARRLRRDRRRDGSSSPARVAVHRTAPAAAPPTDTTNAIPAKETLIDG